MSRPAFTSQKRPRFRVCFKVDGVEQETTIIRSRKKAEALIETLKAEGAEEWLVEVWRFG